jgi:hypothetical protein
MGALGCVHCECCCGRTYCLMQLITCSSTHSPRLRGRTLESVAYGDGGKGSHSQCFAHRNNSAHSWGPRPCCRHKLRCRFVRRWSCDQKECTHMHSLQTFCTFSRSLVAVGNLILVKKWRTSRAARGGTRAGESFEESGGSGVSS